MPWAWTSMSRSSGGRFCDLPATEDALVLLDLSADDFTAAARLVAQHARDDDDRVLLRLLGPVSAHDLPSRCTLGILCDGGRHLIRGALQ